MEAALRPLRVVAAKIDEMPWFSRRTPNLAQEDPVVYCGEVVAGGGAYQVGDKIDFDKCTRVVREITPNGKVMVMYKNKLMTVEQVESLLQKKESVKRKK